MRTTSNRVVALAVVVVPAFVAGCGGDDLEFNSSGKNGGATSSSGVGDPGGSGSTSGPTGSGGNSGSSGGGDPGSTSGGEPGSSSGGDSGSSGGGMPIPPYDCASHLPSPTSIADLKAGFVAANSRGTALEILKRRYPDGAFVVAKCQPKTFEFHMTGKTSSFDALCDGLPTGVHECLHEIDRPELGAVDRTWYVSADEAWSAPQVELFNRSEIVPYLPRSAQSLQPDYVETYLTGSSGAQDIEMLLEEFSAYTVTLYVAKALQGQGSAGSSHRDGLHAMMLFTEVYLHVAMNDHPADYQAIKSNVALVDTIRGLWARATCLDDLTKNDHDLQLGDGVQDAALSALVYDPEWLKYVEGL